MKSNQEIDKKILVSGKVMDSVFTGEMTANESLENTYYEELADRRKNDPSLANKSAVQIALLDAGVGKSTKIGTVLDQTISTGTDTNEWLIPAWMDETLHESIYAQDILQYIVGTPINVDSTVLKAATLDLLSTANKDATKRKRVSEGADLPLAKIFPLGFQVDGFCSTPYPPILGLSLAQWALVAFVLVVILVPLLASRNRKALR